MLYIAVNNFSVMSGRFLVFVGKYIMEANTINPDQTAALGAREQSGLSPYCLQYRLPKKINR